MMSEDTATELLTPPNDTFEFHSCWYQDVSLTSTSSSISKVLRNDVMSHVRTMESLNQAGRGLLEVGSGDSPHGLQSRLEQLNESWEFVRCETERRQLELENRLSQVKKKKSLFCYSCIKNSIEKLLAVYIVHHYAVY